MGIPVERTKDYEKDTNELAGVCKILADTYQLTVNQTVVQKVNVMMPPSEGPIEFRNSDGKLVAYVSVLPRINRTDIERGIEPKMIGIEEVTLSLYKNRFIDHQQFASDFRAAYEKYNPAFNVEEATKKPLA